MHLPESVANNLYKWRPTKSTSKIGLFLGPLLFVAVLLFSGDDIPHGGTIILGCAAWMVTWWVTEAIPVYGTSLIPLIVFPSFGVIPIEDTSSFYVDEIVLLFFGGFLLAKSLENTGLHKRLALNILKIFGTNPKKVIGAFILATGFLSAWMTNTATAILMMPIAAAVISQVRLDEEKSKFGTCLMLSLAYAASLGGLATLIGTPPNAIFASFSKAHSGIDINFAQWMLIGLPLSLVSLLILWLYMANYGKIGRVTFVYQKEFVHHELSKLGKMSSAEKRVAILFTITALAWITRGLVWKDFVPFVEDYTIALIAAFVLLVLPSSQHESGKSIARPILDFKSATKIPWGVLILIGGGLALAGTFTYTGLDSWFAEKLTFVQGLDFLVIILVIVALTIFASEIMSNTATAALLIPVMFSLSGTLGINPIFLTAPVAFATSYGFTIPVGTPPNALVFGSGYVTAGKMARYGLPLNFIGIALVTLFMGFLVPLVWSA